MSYRHRLIYLIILDSIIVLTSIYITNFILLPNHSIATSVLIISSISLLFAHHTFAYIYKLYKRAWEYASIGELLAITQAITYSILTTAIIQIIFFQQVYIRALTITWMLHILLIGGSRFSWRLIRDTYIKKKKYKTRALIIGAGSAGNIVARLLKNNSDNTIYPVAFIDDDPHKHYLNIMGIPVIGGIDKIQQAVEDLNINHIIIAIPSLSKKELNRIYLECAKTNAKTQTVPNMEDLILGNLSVNKLRDVQVEDLLGREPVELDTENISHYITDKTILVTGAGGSIGSEICRQVAEFSPKKMILLGHGENSIYSIELELTESYKEIELVAEIADIQDYKKMLTIMEKHKPNVVYHAAAHKHVPLMERNPDEAIKNNVIGTKNLAEAADKHNVEVFVMISTDKAVNPTSVMGSTKRIAEMIIQHMDHISKTRFVAVRFGNVLGSRGSVIPLFKEQIRKGGPVTVTHPDMERYFMTIPEASRLVIQAGALAKGGEIFVLDMGDPVKIVDLAKNLIKLSGYDEDDIEIRFTGIRPGEKLYEELLNSNEIHDQQVYPQIYIGKSTNVELDIIEELICSFKEMSIEAIRDEILIIANGRYQKKYFAVAK